MTHKLKIQRRIQLRMNEIEDALRLTCIPADRAEELCDMFILNVQKELDKIEHLARLDEESEERKRGRGEIER